MKARIFEIKRFAVHDGDGIRTTVFFKGCPLKCVWCHNPEGICENAQLAYSRDKCISCAECVSVCPAGAHKVSLKGHIFERSLCKGCGECAKSCTGNALIFYGREMTSDELLCILLEDKDFYANSGGGVTLSGGECLMQAEFCAELLAKLKEHGIHTAVDTCGFVSKKALDKVMPSTDIFLYDLKAYDEDVHIKCTGQSNKIILENLEYIDRCGKSVEIRVPYVPGFNDTQMRKLSDFVKKLKNVTKVKVLPYHNFAGSKYASLGMQNTLPGRLPQSEEIGAAEALFENIL